MFGQYLLVREWKNRTPNRIAKYYGGEEFSHTVNVFFNEGIFQKECLWTYFCIGFQMYVCIISD